MRISDWSSDVCSSDLPQLRQQIEGTDGDKLRDAIAAANPRRIILMRCESDDAIEIGRAHGISLFQGYFLDHLLAEKITREEAAERLGAALARHRPPAAQNGRRAGRGSGGPVLSSPAVAG